jgi:hypothetical protein
MSHEEKTDRELLIETRNDVEWLTTLVEKHLADHHRMLYIVLSAFMTFLGALILSQVV